MLSCKQKTDHSVKRVGLDEKREKDYRMIIFCPFEITTPVAEEAFKEAGLKLITIGDYEHTVEIAAQTGYISKNDIEVLREWRKDPANWKQNK